MQQQGEQARAQREQNAQLLLLQERQMTILEEIRTSLRDQRREYRKEIAALRSEVHSRLGLPQSQPTQTLPAPHQLTPPPAAGVTTPGTFPLSPLLRTDLRPVLSPLPALALLLSHRSRLQLLPQLLLPPSASSRQAASLGVSYLSRQHSQSSSRSLSPTALWHRAYR